MVIFHSYGYFFRGPTISPISPDHCSWVDCLMRRQWLFNGLKTSAPNLRKSPGHIFWVFTGTTSERKRYIIVLLTWYLRSHGILSCQESATFKTRCFNTTFQPRPLCLGVCLGDIAGWTQVIWALIRGKSLLQVLSEQRRKHGPIGYLWSGHPQG